MVNKAEIAFEVEETLILKQGEKLVYEHCPRCDQKVGMITPELLAKLYGTSEREIFRMLEAGLIHFVEVERVLVCFGCYRNSVGAGAKTYHHPNIVIKTIEEKAE